MQKWLYEQLQHNPVVQQIDQQESHISFSSAIQEALCIAASYQKKPRPILVLKKNVYEAQKLYEKLVSLLSEEECNLFGADESLRVEAIASTPLYRGQQVETLASILKNPNQIVVSCPSSFIRYLPLKTIFQETCLTIKVNDLMDKQQMEQRLILGGYQKTSHIDIPLTYASRGGIIDVFSMNYEYPIRIEFFDTEIESIRFFDIQSQKTIKTIDEVEIIPATTLLFTQQQKQDIIEKIHTRFPILPSGIESDLTLFEQGLIENHMYQYFALSDQVHTIMDYLNSPTVILNDTNVLVDQCKAFIQDSISYIQEMVQEEKMLDVYDIFADFYRLLNQQHCIEEDPFLDNLSNIYEVHLPNQSLELKLKVIHQHACSVLCLSHHQLERVIQTCVEEKIPYSLLEDQLKPGINIVLDTINMGFQLLDQGIYVYTTNELFQIQYHHGRYENKFRSAEILNDFDELVPGDYVVHASYGVGQYIGIETKEIQNIKRDFLKIVYRGNSELFVPLEQFKLVRKFVSRQGVVPKLNKLGTNEWEKTKQKLQENVEEIASRLLHLYANRRQNIGFAFSKDNELTMKFDQACPFELTIDQQKAVQEIKADMEKNIPMDRLVCGDVGFGKTEVAIRASFKAVCDGKQVAVLCPTTILAEQHYHTFLKRYEGFPVNIQVLDRFVLGSKQKQIIQQTKEKKVDILIGTHRILSNDVRFQDLGLLIIDEEQRFGVEHKEKIQELKNGIDVLTLSATPIPRTLQMSLVGIRSLSLLETPPLNRYSVQTYVVEKKKELVIDAIEKELARGGQVFYLYNHVEQMYRVAQELRSALPEARIGVVHGQLDRDEIEDIMYQFTNKQLDVLVCTTIVENGIDIPNANTILLENAQDFGLAQIYQIKGRVGRSSRVAYAYLLIPPRRQLSEIAQKRLQAVKEFAKMGSGYKIAMRDLTIRGAGDLLGSSQSGFIDTVGIDMYIEMLEQALLAKKENRPIEQNEPKPNANIQKTSYIPSTFAPDDFDKLKMYQKIEKIDRMEDLMQFQNEVIDQYGKLPKEVMALFEKKQLDMLLNDERIEQYREINGQVELTLSQDFSQTIDGVKLFEKYNKMNKDMLLRYTNQRIHIILPKKINTLGNTIQAIQIAKESVKHEN